MNGKHCKTYGPVQLIELNKLIINESEILDECGVAALGFEVNLSSRLTVSHLTLINT